MRMDLLTDCGVELSFCDGYFFGADGKYVDLSQDKSGLNDELLEKAREIMEVVKEMQLMVDIDTFTNAQ